MTKEPRRETQDQPSPNRSQIRSRERVRDFAEVYTHEREVNAMLDLVSDMFPGETDPGNTDRTFLEPACGSGNFLIEILRRKLVYVTPCRYGRGERFEHRIFRCLASIYGIDISADNVTEARERMRAVVGEHLAAHGATETTPGFRAACDAVLATNVICADTLADAAEIELVAYEPGANGTFIREWSRPLDPAAGVVVAPEGRGQHVVRRTADGREAARQGGRSRPEAVQLVTKGGGQEREQGPGGSLEGSRLSFPCEGPFDSRRGPRSRRLATTTGRGAVW